ncbi:hypothetical protein ES703_109926 [subsurface metagenome]
MAVEQIRGCGFRKVGGMYLFGEYISSPCDRMPFPLTTCPVCGQGIKVSRGFTEVNPHRLWGIHQDCKDNFRPCFLCDPQDELAYIMLVGAGSYKTPQDFLEEAHRMGISKRIPFIPKGMELGKTVVYLAHPKAVEVKLPVLTQQISRILEGEEPKQPRLVEAEKVGKALGIFCAFIPKRVEKLVWESELTDKEREKLEKRGITPVPIPDGESDHG